jgi:KDO2-lipid IV(A) lauroyltransferase
MGIAAATLFAAMGLLGRLPLRWLQALARPLGALTRLRGGREAQVARVNLAMCLSEHDATERERLRRACLRHTACTALETSAVWTRPAAASLRWIVAVEGAEHLDAAEAAGRGVIVAAPHLGNWELLSLYLASRRPLGVVYRPPEWPALEPLLRRARAHPGVEPLRAEPAVVRRMLGLLRSGGSLGILPDQRPKAGEGVLAPLLGVPALTMTLLPRLAQRTGASVVFAFAERLPAARGFRVRVLPAPTGLDDPDPVHAATALNSGIEACIRLAPEQYQWSYKRYPARDAEGVARYGGHVTQP